jgi:hypothetical protein
MKKEDENFKPSRHYQDEKGNWFFEFSKEDSERIYKKFYPETNKKIPMKKADLFSLSSTLLAIFGLLQLDVSNLFLFMVLVAIYTIAMDFVYKACK